MLVELLNKRKKVLDILHGKADIREQSFRLKDVTVGITPHRRFINGADAHGAGEDHFFEKQFGRELALELVSRGVRHCIRQHLKMLSNALPNSSGDRV